MSPGQDIVVPLQRPNHPRPGRSDMFVQVIKGRVADPARVKAALDRWAEELAPGAEGWLGTTAGVTEDGRFIAAARFESEEAARRNSDRPEQDRWWSETSRLFDGEPSFSDSSQVDVDTNGDPATATFVQVMQGRARSGSLVRPCITWTKV